MESYCKPHKILIIGDSGVGKTCLLNRYIDNTFTEVYHSTIGLDFRIKVIEHDKKLYKLQIWDTAGQERFKTITSHYYRGSQGIILCYDTTNLDSFKNIEKWYEDAMTLSKNPNISIVLVGLKSDLHYRRQVSRETAEAFANERQIGFAEVSSKEKGQIPQGQLPQGQLPQSQLPQSQLLQSPSDVFQLIVSTIAKKQKLLAPEFSDQTLSVDPENVTQYTVRSKNNDNKCKCQ